MLTDINELWIGYLLLSEQFHYIQHFILFQYISCYSLSIKTMVSVGIRKVSIHLMLLFIGLLQSNSEPHSPFQYISCYSLSLMFKNSNGDNYVSIHLMLLFILIGPQETIPFMPVSIHLMLLFIIS